MKAFDSAPLKGISGSSAFEPHLFPHDNVEATTGLVGEHNAGEVVVSVGVHVKRHTEVHRAEYVISCLNKCALVSCPNGILLWIF